MACNLTKGFTLDCNDGIGGVKEIFFQKWSNFATGVTINSTTGVIDGLPTTTIYRYQPNRNTGALTVTPTVNLENGTLYYLQTVELTLNKLSPDKKLELESLAKAKLAVFIRLFDDQIVMVGRTDGAFLTAGTYASGKAKGDLNGYQITITAEEQTQPEFLDAYDPTTETPFENFAGITVSPAY